MNQLRDLQVAFHARHEGQHDPINDCQDESCREAKMGVSYLNSKGSFASGTRPIDLK
jgi:hypothetical protein